MSKHFITSFVFLLLAAGACQSGKNSKTMQEVIASRLGEGAVCTDSPDGRFTLCQKPKDGEAAMQTANSAHIHAIVLQKSDSAIVFEKVVLGGSIAWAQGCILKVTETLGIDPPKAQKPFYDVEKQLWTEALPLAK